MRGNTKVCVGFRNIGDAAESPQYMDDAPLTDVIRVIINYLGAVVMNKRVEIVIGRDMEYIRSRFEDSRAAKAVRDEVFDDEIRALMERGPQETDDPEDTWVNPT